ncbi:MAG: T9SS type A sorting domain-containing protein, partial [Muribaculaceae bacterium]|nr:T9SS type A sorting domain-containing protein [Muribaculaceae bacterium]
ITYIAKNGDKTTVFPNGYHVYRDGDRLTDEFVTLPTFADATAPEGKTVTYHVSAVYNEGESRLSNPAEIMVDLSGVGVIETGAAIITAGEGTVTVTGAIGQTINVYAADGRVVASKEASAATTIYLQKGIYLVRLQQSNQVAKVVVR